MGSSVRIRRLRLARARAAAALGSMVLAITPLHAATDLAELSLEQLSDIVVTSVSRRQERLGAAAASVYVISSEDIRRSGATTLPEALRLAPNLQVARADANQYAINAARLQQHARQQDAGADRRAHRLQPAVLRRVLGRCRTSCSRTCCASR